MANILVTGASGFVGRNLIKALVHARHRVRCAVTRPIDMPEVDYILVNRIEDQKDWSQALKDIDVVIHLAAKVHEFHKNQEVVKSRYLAVNYQAVENLASQAAAHGVRRFIFLSTIKVNGESTSPGIPYKESNIPQPSDAYSQSKLQAESCLQKLSQQAGMEFVIIRPPLVYGPEVKANFLKLLYLSTKQWPFPFASMTNKRSYIFIDNLVSAIIAVIDNPKAANQIYLVADKELLTLPQLMQYLAKGMDNKLRLFPIPTRVLVFLLQITGLKHLHTRLFASLEVSADKIKDDLGWVPPVSALDGLEKTAQWYRYESDS